MNSEKNVSEESGIFNYLDQERPTSRVSRVPKALAIAASVVIILAGVQAASGLLGPMLLGLFLAIVLLVPLRWLQSQGCPHFLAFLFVMLCTVALFVGIMYFILGSMNAFIGRIPAIRDDIVFKYDQLERQLEQIGFMIGEGREKVRGGLQRAPGEQPMDIPVVSDPPPEVPRPVVVPEPIIIDKTIDPDGAEPPDSETHGTDETEQTPVGGDDPPPLPPEGLVRFIEEMEKKQQSLTALDPQSVTLWLARIALHARQLLEWGFLVLIFTIFMLLEASYFPAKVRRAFSKDSPINIEHFHRIADDVRHYLILKTAANLMSGGAAMGVYYMFGVPGWFFWGIIAFFMYYIPNIGGTLAAIIPGILILISKDVSWVVLYAFCLLTVECTIAYGIEPKILGHGLRLSTIVIILSLFFWGFLLGAIGLFLAAPLTVMTKIVLQAFPETRWIAIFLDGGRAEYTDQKECF